MLYKYKFVKHTQKNKAEQLIAATILGLTLLARQLRTFPPNVV